MHLVGMGLHYFQATLMWTATRPVSQRRAWFAPTMFNDIYSHSGIEKSMGWSTRYGYRVHLSSTYNWFRFVHGVFLQLLFTLFVPLFNVSTYPTPVQRLFYTQMQMSCFFCVFHSVAFVVCVCVWISIVVCFHSFSFHIFLSSYFEKKIL